MERIPIARGASIGKDALDRALHGGEDYELLFTMPEKREPPAGTTRIGTIVRGRAGAVRFQGEPLEPRGHDHFRQ